MLNAGTLVRPTKIAPALRHRMTQRALVGRHLVLERHHAVGGRAPGDVDVDLQRHRHAVQRAELGAALHRRVGPVGRRERFVGHEIDDRVDARIDRLDSREAALYRLARRDLARADRAGEISGPPAPQFVRHLYQRGQIEREPGTYVTMTSATSATTTNGITPI